jgi:predicted O-linked N-acetylglucosamine transferase (SPINDLY family)
LTLYYQELKRWSDAYRHVQAWLADAPDNADAHNEAGLILIQLRQPEAARQAFEQALQRAPEFAEVWTNLGRLAKSCGLMNEALDAYKRAVEIRPDYVEGWYNLGMLYDKNGQTLAARQAVGRALSQQPMLFRPAQTGPSFLPTPASERALLLLRQSMILPRVYADQSEIEAYRAQLFECFNALQGIDLQVAVPERELMGLTPFYLAYQGQNDRDINSALARLLAPVLDLAPPLPASPRGPLRIGLVSAFFQDHSVTHCFGSMIQALAAEPDWEVTLFLTPAAQPDAVTHLGAKAQVGSFAC